jgi:hypothetical protein
MAGQHKGEEGDTTVEGENRWLEDSQQGWKIKTEEVFIAETKEQKDQGRSRKKIGPRRQRVQDEARMPQGRGQDDREGRMKQQEDRLVKTG